MEDFSRDSGGRFPVGNLAIVGLGLLGGSIALGARRLGLASTITAVGRRGYRQAVEEALVDDETTDLGAASARADFIILCTPVDVMAGQLPVVMAHARPGTVVTDVGSTKSRLVELAESLGGGARFVGSHPMVGSHLTGWQNATAVFFGGGITYVTPTERTDLEAAAIVGTFWEKLGARIVYTDPDRHDRLCAMLSHVPHMTAVALMQLLSESSEDVHLLKLLAGPGFRDTTRVAMGSADVWSEICSHNSDKIAVDLERLAEILRQFAVQIRRQDESLHKRLDDLSRLRGQF